MENSGQFNIRRQVSETDSVYQEERAKAHRNSEHIVWGKEAKIVYEDSSDEIKSIENHTKRLQDLMVDEKEEEFILLYKKKMEENEEKIKLLRAHRTKAVGEAVLEMGWQTDELLDQEGFEDRKKYVLKEIHDMCDIPEVVQALESDEASAIPSKVFESLWIKIKEGTLSEEVFYKMIVRHQESIKQQEAKLEQTVEEIKSEFKNVIEDAVAKGLLPQSAGDNLERIDSVKAYFRDLLIDQSTSNSASIDYFGRINVNSENLDHSKKAKFRHVVFHELLHEISGQSLTISSPKDRPAKEIQSFQRKSGVALFDQGESYSPNRWLNEAITESLSLKLSGYKGDGSEKAYEGSGQYVAERKELQRLIDSGLQPETINNAYFENFSPESREKAGIHFAELLKNINAIEGKSGFTKLENQHLMYEIEDTLKDMYFFEPEVLEQHPILKKGTKIFEVAVTVGTSKETVIEKKFVRILDSTGKREDFELLLENMRTPYEGKMRYVINERKGD